MKLWGRKSAREDARPALGRASAGAGVMGEWPRSYEAQLREGYAANPVAQRAVRLIAQNAGAAPIAGGAAALVAARSAGQALLETLAAQLLLHGNAYVQVIGDGAGGVAELYALRPERVSVEADARGWPVAYRYKVGERTARLAADGPLPEIIHVRSFNPLDDHYGLGCLGAAAGAIAIHNAATRWNKALLDNAARPSGALVYDAPDGAALSADQFARLRTEMEAGFAGAANAGRPMLLEGGLKWQAMSLTPADMDFVGLKAAAAREIALAFGVPPMLLGLPGDATYANYREANKALWRLAVLPLTDTVLSGLSQGLSGWLEDASLRVEVDRVPALSEDRERLWAQVTLDWRQADLSPGDRVALAGEPGSWRIVDWTLDAMVLTLDLVQIARATMSAAAATSGRVLSDSDAAIGRTLLHAFEIPPVDDTVLASPRLSIAAAGSGAGWRSARAQLSTDGGVSFHPLPELRSAAVLGTLAMSPGAGSSTLVDRHAVIEVVLAHKGMTLTNSDPLAVAAGANLALVGDELLQWERAEWLGDTRWRLTRLWRGRRGTEWACGQQAAGDRFVVLQPGALLEVPLPLAAIGSRVRVIASGVGDGDAPIETDVLVSGASVVPPSPVHLRVTADGAGGAQARWVRRSRAGWAWLDGIDAPLVEERERYVLRADGNAQLTASDGPVAALPAASLAGASGVQVQQVGLQGLSRPAITPWPTQATKEDA